MIYGRLNCGLLTVRELGESRGCVTRGFLWPRGSRLRRAEEVEGVTGQEDSKLVKTEAISQLDVSDAFTLLVLYLGASCLFALPVTVLKLETMAVIMTVVSVYSVRLLFGISLILCGVSAVISVSVFECLFISFRMARWGALMTWLRSILSITAPPSATCVKGWRRYGNAK